MLRPLMSTSIRSSLRQKVSGFGFQASGLGPRISRYRLLHGSSREQSSGWLSLQTWLNKLPEACSLMPYSNRTAQTQGVDFLRAGANKGRGAGAHGGAGGEDIVDQEYFAPVRCAGPVGACDVGPPLGRRELDLVPCAAHDF